MKELPPGRELDALIAEKVMGLNVEHSWVWSKEIPRSNQSNQFCERCGYFPGPPILEPNAPPCVPHNYSTDIAAAWQVVELFGSRYGTMAISFSSGGVVGKPQKILGWMCEAFIGRVDKRGYAKPIEAYADTAPFAICLAALEAVEKRTPK